MKKNIEERERSDKDERFSECRRREVKISLSGFVLYCRPSASTCEDLFVLRSSAPRHRLD
ncbi:hypothetical protein ABVT39_024951 [Epinephelus coioides]